MSDDLRCCHKVHAISENALISYLFNNARLTAVEASLNNRIDNLSARIETRQITIEGDLRQFYRDLGAHEADISNLKNRFRGE